MRYHVYESVLIGLHHFYEGDKVFLNFFFWNSIKLINEFACMSIIDSNRERMYY